MLKNLDSVLEQAVVDYEKYVADLGERLLIACSKNKGFNLTSEEVDIICSVGFIASLFVLDLLKK